MAFVLADRVQETSTTTGTGSMTLAGAVAGYRTFNAAVGAYNNTYYAIVSASGTEWEVGYGYLNGSTYLDRSTVYASSNSGSRVNFSAGTKNVFVTMAASRAVTTDSPAFPQFTIDNSSTITAGNPVALESGYIKPVLQYGQSYTPSLTNVRAAVSTGNVQGISAYDPATNSGYPICLYSPSGTGIYGTIGYLGYAASNTYSFDASSSNQIAFMGSSIYTPLAYSGSYDRIAKRVQIHYANSSGNTVLLDGNVGQTSFNPTTPTSSGYSVTSVTDSSMAQTYCVTQDCLLTFYIDSSNNLKCLKYYKNSPSDWYSNYVSAYTIASGFSSASGYVLAASFDEANASAILLVQDVAASTVTGYAINPNGGSSSAPVAGTSVTINSTATSTLNASSIAYAPGFGGCIYTYAPLSTGSPTYVKITASGTALTVGAAVSNASTLGPSLTNVSSFSVQTAAVSGGTYGMFGYVVSTGGTFAYWAESFNCYGGTLTLAGSTMSVASTGAVNTRWLAGVFQPRSSNYDFAFFPANPSPAYLTYFQVKAANSNYSKFIGVAQSSGTGSQVIPVAITYNLATDPYASYTVGAKYYCSAGGTLTTTASPIFVGYALAYNQIMVGNSPGLTS